MASLRRRRRKVSTTRPAPTAPALIARPLAKPSQDMDDARSPGLPRPGPRRLCSRPCHPMSTPDQTEATRTSTMYERLETASPTVAHQRAALPVAVTAARCAGGWRSNLASNLASRSGW
eukprot:scaffold2262_cov51-Phaeocystis_antarctica.AAC.1